jgi:hypothetical protein
MEMIGVGKDLEGLGTRIEQKTKKMMERFTVLHGLVAPLDRDPNEGPRCYASSRGLLGNA